jgi:hypothetical protein
MWITEDVEGRGFFWQIVTMFCGILEGGGMADSLETEDGTRLY